MRTIVRGEGVGKSFRTGDHTVPALAGVDVEVRSGEFVAVTGPSGSGKTTLLHCLSGILTPDEGRVLIGDTELADLDDDARAELRRDRMGFVFQRLNLLPPLTVAENIQLPLVLRGDGKAEVEQRTRELLELVSMPGRGDAFPRELSGGEAQRVAIARALAAEPEVIWADEPTGQLDRDNALEVVGLLASLVDDGATVVMVTHDEELASAASRRVRLVDGRLA